jgi:hypothetical protein
MKKSLIAVASIVWGSTVAAEPVDMTGLACDRLGVMGMTQTWEFYGDVAIAYYPDGSVVRLPRIGEGAYEKFDETGEWVAVYYFFDAGDGVQMRVLAKAGLLVREQNRAAPLEKGVLRLEGPCVPINEK